MLRRLYDWTIKLSASRHAPWALGAVSAAESSVFPLPPDIILIPMVLARRDKAWIYAAICTAASVIGGILGYAIGYFLFDTIGMYVLNLYGYQDAFQSFASRYNDYGVWIVLIAGITPFPYKVITIASGVTGLNFFVFMLASIVARGARFFLVSALLWWFGEPIRAFIDRYFGLLTIVFMVLLIGGFVVARYLV